MAQGSSGRVVIDIDPVLKKDIYDAIRSRGSNMREWFLHMVEREFELSEAERHAISNGEATTERRVAAG